MSWGVEYQKDYSLVEKKQNTKIEYFKDKLKTKKMPLKNTLISFDSFTLIPQERANRSEFVSRGGIQRS